MKKVFYVLIILLTLGLVLYLISASRDPETIVNNQQTQNDQTTSTIDTTMDPATTMSKHTNSDLGFSVEYPSEWNLEKQGKYAVKIFKTMKKPAASESNYILIQVVPTKLDIDTSEIYDFNPEAIQKLKEGRGNKIVLTDSAEMERYFTYAKLPGIMIDNVESTQFANSNPWEKPAGTKEIKHIFALKNKTIIFTAFLGNDSSDQFYISEENYQRILNTLRFSENDSFSETGTITGRLCFPSEVIPEGYIEALATDNKTKFSVSYPGSVKGGKNNYSVSVTPGEYILRFKTNNLDGYHTDVCPTGLEQSCAADNPRKHLPAKVTAGGSVTGIDLCDFYYNQKTKPEF